MGLTSDQGSISTFTAVVCLGLLAFTGLAVDGGEALATKTQALGQAEDAARAGAQALDMRDLRHRGAVTLDPALAERDALAYLDSQGVHGTVSADPREVSVQVTDRVPTEFLALVGIRALTVTGTGTARATTGDTP